MYESLFHFTMALVLWRLAVWDQLRTHRLQFYLICYGLFRFLTEYVRPEPTWALGLTFYQWASLLFDYSLVQTAKRSISQSRRDRTLAYRIRREQ